MSEELFKSMAQSIIDGDAEVAEKLARQAIERAWIRSRPSTRALWWE